MAAIFAYIPILKQLYEIIVAPAKVKMLEKENSRLRARIRKMEKSIK